MSQGTPGRWERLYLANLARSDADWASRQRLVVAMGALLAVGGLALLGVSFLVAEATVLRVAVLAMLAAVLVFLRHLHLYMGIMRGALAHGRRER